MFKIEQYGTGNIAVEFTETILSVHVAQDKFYMVLFDSDSSIFLNVIDLTLSNNLWSAGIYNRPFTAQC